MIRGALPARVSPALGQQLSYGGPTPWWSDSPWATRRHEAGVVGDRQRHDTARVLLDVALTNYIIGAQLRRYGDVRGSRRPGARRR